MGILLGIMGFITIMGTLWVGNVVVIFFVMGLVTIISRDTHWVSMGLVTIISRVLLGLNTLWGSRVTL